MSSDRAPAVRPLRLMVVIPRYAPVFGGAENQCRLLNRYLVRSSHITIVSVLTARIRRSFAPCETIDGITVRRLGGAGVGRWVWYRFFLSTAAHLDQGLEELRAVGARAARIIPNGVDTSMFRPPTVEERAGSRARLRLQDSAVVFAFTGRFVLLKGLDLLLPAFRTLLTAHAADAVRLILVGSGELQEESITESLTPERLGPDMATAVHLYPATDDVRPFLFASDVFVMPSRHEGLSNAVLEAIACGLVCVLSDIPPHRELRERSPGHPIYLFSSGDSVALATALEQSSAAVRAMRVERRSARSGLAAAFDIGTVAERYSDMLREIAPRATS